MNKHIDRGELVIYQAADNSDFQIEVRVKDDTVWLNRHQIAQLFERDIKTIGKHIANAVKEELHSLPVVANFATTASDGKSYQVEHYNLDMIISIGYRVKSRRGVQFRVWANKILKDYLLKGYSTSHRIEKIENDVNYLKGKVNEFDVHIKTSLPPHEGIFYDGQIFDAYQFISEIVRSAAKSIILVDNYIDDRVLALLSKRSKDVKVTIYTADISPKLKLDLKLYNEQYPAVSIKIYTKSHDRFLIIDSLTVYHIGASLKDLGKKWFAFSKIKLDVNEMMKKLEKRN